MTNTPNTSGAHRPEAVPHNARRRMSPTGDAASHGGGTPVAGAILAQSWRDQATAVRSDQEFARGLRALDRRS